MQDNIQFFNDKSTLDVKLLADSGIAKNDGSHRSNIIEEKITKILADISQKRFKTAFQKVKKLKTKYPALPSVWNIAGIFEVETSKYDEAIVSFKKVIELGPNSPSGYMNLLRLLINMGNLDDAEKYLKISIPNFPNNSEMHYLYAKLEYQRNNFENVLKCCKEALRIKPDFPEVLLTLGNALRELDNIGQAKKCYEMSLRFNASSAEALNNIGACYKMEEDYERAIGYFERAQKINPKIGQVENNIGSIAEKLGDISRAIKCYENAVLLNPELKEPYSNLAVIYITQKEYDKAFQNLSEILKRHPDDFNALNNIAIIMTNIGKYEHAIKYYKKILSIDSFASSKNADTILRNLGNAHKELGQLETALGCFEDAMMLNANSPDAILSAMSIKHGFCDWDETPKQLKSRSLIGIEGEPVAPFTMLRFEDNQEKQLIRSKRWGQKTTHNIVNKKLIKQDNTKNERVKIGYFGSDFSDHATLFLMLGLLRNHDKNKFEIYIFSYGRGKKGSYGHEVQRHCTKFFDVQSASDQKIIELALKIGLDIAVDLKGYTKDTRSQLFAYNLAPVQINYLGYPSSMGVDHIQYIVADKTIIPEHYQDYYSEKIIWMPDSYQPNDDQRKISHSNYKKSDFGLPEKSIILCCHNQPYKITVAEFDIWMNILMQNSMCILWLLADNENVKRNLLKEASKRGVESERIIFCKPIKHEEHLARLKLADVFLDTFFVNAHTTASDALWAGVPVVTKIGEQFAARVAASLLSAIGLDELITRTNEEYEGLIAELVSCPDRIDEIKEKLHKNIKTKPLFNTKLYTKNFEKALLEVHQISSNGENPRNIVVDTERR